MNNLVLYPPTKPSIEHENFPWQNFETYKSSILSLLTIEKDLSFKNNMEADTIKKIIRNHHSVSHLSF